MQDDAETQQKLKEQKMQQERKGFEDSMNYINDLLGKSNDNSAKEK